MAGKVINFTVLKVPPLFCDIIHFAIKGIFYMYWSIFLCYTFLEEDRMRTKGLAA